MLGITKLNNKLSILTGIALLFAASISATAAGVVRADINVRGNVTVNELPTFSSSTVLTGSTIVTKADSGAVIGIGGNGRIELMPETALTLEYGSDTISAVLTSGAIKVTNAVGIAVTVTTTDAVIAADSGRSNSFSIDSANSGSLTEGKLTVVSATDNMRITANGRVVSLVTGESVVQDDDDDDDDNTLVAILLFGGAAAAILIPIALSDGGNKNQFTTPGNQVSPFIP